MKKTTFHYLSLVIASAFLLSSCGDNNVPGSEELYIHLHNALKLNSDGIGAPYYTLPESNDLASIPQDPNNPLTAEKVALGQFLFHETAMAVNPENAISIRTFSCSSCHFAEAGFQANRIQGIGEGGLGFGIAGEDRINHPIYMASLLDVQPVRTPSVMNGAWQECNLWNGQFGATGINADTEYAWTEDTPKEKNHLGFQGLETQAIAGLDVHRLEMNPEIAEEHNYIALFDEAFPFVTEGERYSNITAGLAIGAFERSVISNKAPFQQWLKGDLTAMSDVEIRGAITFFTKGECVTCHNGPNLANMEFHSLGMQDLNGPGVFNTNPTDGVNRGRESFSRIPEDLYCFKVPQLYNLRDSKFYGHGSSFRDIYEVLEYKNNGVKENNFVPTNRLSPHFKPLELTEQELRELYAFLNNALYDDQLSRYAPDALPSGLCFPNNDVVSREDLGCN
ncbi:MAG: cytochrome c peroxidase [Limisphaerales bacterium]|jgi:cytochrome c peroxidase